MRIVIYPAFAQCTMHINPRNITLIEAALNGRYGIQMVIKIYSTTSVVVLSHKSYFLSLVKYVLALQQHDSSHLMGKIYFFNFH